MHARECKTQSNKGELMRRICFVGLDSNAWPGLGCILDSCALLGCTLVSFVQNRSCLLRCEASLAQHVSTLAQSSAAHQATNNVSDNLAPLRRSSINAAQTSNRANDPFGMAPRKTLAAQVSTTRCNGRASNESSADAIDQSTANDASKTVAGAQR